MWGFLWIMVALKIPLGAMIYIVWWAVRQTPEEPTPNDEDGGTKLRHRHPRQPFPRHPRRGPHGGPATRPPARVRSVVRARAHSTGH
ncbi:MAG: hypothetical protein ABSH51_15510 [Solirubrobacteraceae bacterium]|jgi:hypothetical protein